MKYPSTALPKGRLRAASIALAAATAATLGGGCGGADAPSDGADASSTRQQAQAAARNTSNTSSTGTTGTTGRTGTDPRTPQAAVQGLAQITLGSTARAEQMQVPFSFGQPFAPGALRADAGLVAALPDGSQLPLQMDVKATHADGSVRHAVVSGVLPRLAAAAQVPLVLQAGPAPRVAGVPYTPAELLRGGFKAGVQVTVDGRVYTAAAETLLQQDGAGRWLQGQVANEWLLQAPLRDAAGNAHPHLSARFAVRGYAGQNRAKVDVVLENDWAYEPAPRNFVYDLRVTLGSAVALEQKALTHFHHARWKKTFWWGGEPQLQVQHRTESLLASRALPSYDGSIVPTEAALSGLAQNWANASTGLMTIGIMTPYMPQTGARSDIAPLPRWAALYLLSMDPRAKAVTLGVGDLAGTWPIHYRDKGTGLPVSLLDRPYASVIAPYGDTVNPKTGKSDAFPACGGDCSTAPNQPDRAHQPSLAYVPYLVTGDHFYLEELLFWANYNMVALNPYYRGFEKGLLRNEQVRGQAWSLRTLGQAAYITPDAHPMKAYFKQRVTDNLDWYNATYTIARPNALGAYDGSGQYAMEATGYGTPSGANTGVAPWQDDYLTWSIGHLAELGFDSARPLLAWKAQFPIGRMTAPGFCWIDGASYALAVKAAPGGAWFSSFDQAYQATMRDKAADGSAISMVNSTGARYLDQPCGSQAQADWLTQRDKDLGQWRQPWLAGEMTGYASAVDGMVAQMQPALAVSASFGLPGAQAAWDRFATRSVKPDYRVAPQWALVPRQR